MELRLFKVAVRLPHSSAAKNMPGNAGTWVQFLAVEIPRRKNITTPYSCLENPMTEEPSRLHSMASQSDKTLSLFTLSPINLKKKVE